MGSQIFYEWRMNMSSEKDYSTALNAIEMYNRICNIEECMAEGVEINNLDIDEMKKTKEMSIAIIESTLGIKVV